MNYFTFKKLLALFLFFQLTFNFSNIYSQDIIGGEDQKIDFANPIEYEIAAINIDGIKYLDIDALIMLSGLKIGDKIVVPGEKISKAIDKLWKQGLFSDIKIEAEKIIDKKIFLKIYLEERPRLLKFGFIGIKKGETDDLRDKLKFSKGLQVTDNLIMNAKNTITTYFIDKGYLNVEVDIIQTNDTLLKNHVTIDFEVRKNKKIKINDIIFTGNTIFTDAKLWRTMKDTKRKKWFNMFNPSKFIAVNLKEDKNKILTKYNDNGFRDAKIVSDSITKFDDKTINLYINIDEGSKYSYRNITWVGNSKYSTDLLNSYLGVKKGDIYNQSLLDNKLFGESGISSLYMDNGYLFFNVTPVEVNIENDSIDLELRIYEGKQARINKVIITGNTKTNEHVVRREIRTKPGQLFSRSDIIRTQRELAQLGYFNPEKMDVKPSPNQLDGTVDIEYIVEERPSDQIELSGGYGAQMIVGTLGLTFNNFSAKNIFKGSAYRPLPSGDGQKLSVRGQTNGQYYQAYSASFVEPWLGGKKPTNFSTSVYFTRQTNGWQVSDENKTYMNIKGVSVGLGKRLKWPDDFFIVNYDLSYQIYELYKWSYFIFNTGTSNTISLTLSLSRNSIDQPIYPRKGSNFSLSVQATPPFSIIQTNKDYSTMADIDKYKWVEFHKWKFKSQWYTKIVGDLVLNTKFEMGLKAIYNPDYGQSPFEGFDLGGDGLSGFNYYGRETIGLRGYESGALTPYNGGNVYDKMTLELRYPLSLNPNATIYALSFLEGGNAWYSTKEFNPFNIKKSAGVGVRIFMPMIGMLGVDWGYGFDNIYNKNGIQVLGKNGSQFAFVLGQQF